MVNHTLRTKISLFSNDPHFDEFIRDWISPGRYKNASEVIRAGLRLLEEEENKLTVLREAIQEGLESGVAHDFNPDLHLESLKSEKNWMAKLEYSNKAVLDLSRIWVYTFNEWSETKADKY